MSRGLKLAEDYYALKRRSRIMRDLAKELDGRNVDLIIRNKYAAGLGKERAERPVNTTEKDRIVELAREIADELDVEAAGVLKMLDGEE